jgi:acetyltransferase-like isoleucine patch superfamily enzyme
MRYRSFEDTPLIFGGSMIGNKDRTAMVHVASLLGANITLGRGSVIDENCVIEDNVFIGHNTVIRNNVHIKRNSVIGHNVVIEAFTKIGEATTIQSQCHITGYAEIGSRCYFGPCVTIINEKRISAFRNNVMDQVLKGPVIGDACRIGARALILPGVVVGKNAVIGAGCVITKNVGENEIWYGSCAVKKGIVPEEERL